MTISRSIIKKWIDDCKVNARSGGATDTDILKALIEVAEDVINDISIDLDIKNGVWRE